MRLTAALLLLAGSTASLAADGNGRYVVQLGHDAFTEWTEIADLRENPDTAIDGTLCLVRKEYVDRPAFPRTLLRLPVVGRRQGDQLELQVPEVKDGPRFGGKAVALVHGTSESETLGPPATWQFDNRPQAELDEDDGHGPPRSEVTQFVSLTNDPHPDKQLGALATIERSSISYYRSKRDAQDNRAASYPMSTYDKLTKSTARSYEKGRLYADLYTDGLVLAAADTSQIGAIEAFLDRLGDGARVLNAELKDCASTKLLLTVSVPPGLELWYSRKLQTSGLTDGAFPEVQGRDPDFSPPYIMSAAVLKAALNAPSIGQKYQAIWNVFEAQLKRFAAQRRNGFLLSGSVVPQANGSDWMYRAELTGRALAICEANRWEKITVQASAQAFDAARGQVTLSINFSDGFLGRGSKAPSDTKFKDNRIPDGDLGKLQAIFVAATKEGRQPGSNIRCQN